MPRISPSTVRPAGTLQRDSLHSTPLRPPTTQPQVLQTRSSLFKTAPQSRLPPVTEYWDDDDVVQYIAADPVETIQPTDVQHALYNYGEIETPQPTKQMASRDNPLSDAERREIDRRGEFQHLQQAERELGNRFQHFFIDNPDMRPAAAAASASTSSSTNPADLQTLSVMQLFTRAMITDAAIAPTRFDGTFKDVDKVDKWVRNFEQYAKLKSFDEDTQLQVFKLLMTDNAADWLTSLPDDQTDTIKHLIDAFKTRFAMTELHKLQKLDQWQRNQKATESVDDYITSIQNAAKKIPVKDNELIRLAIIRGLKPNIKLHVMQSKPETLDGVISAARLAEEALTASGANSDNVAVTELNKTVTQLLDQIKKQNDQQSTIAAVTAAAAIKDPTIPIVAAMDQPTYQPRLQQTFRPTWNRNGQPLNGGRPPYNPGNGTRPQFNRPFNNQRPFQPRAQASQLPPQRSNWNQSWRPNNQQQNFQMLRSCGNCLRQHQSGACPAKETQCFSCYKYGHYSRACRSCPAPNYSSQ